MLEIQAFKSFLFYILQIWNGGSALCDVLIAGAMTYYVSFSVPVMESSSANVFESSYCYSCLVIIRSGNQLKELYIG